AARDGARGEGGNVPRDRGGRSLRREVPLALGDDRALLRDPDAPAGAATGADACARQAALPPRRRRLRAADDARRRRHGDRNALVRPTAAEAPPRRHLLLVLAREQPGDRRTSA